MSDTKNVGRIIVTEPNVENLEAILDLGMRILADEKKKVAVVKTTIRKLDKDDGRHAPSIIELEANRRE